MTLLPFSTPADALYIRLGKTKLPVIGFAKAIAEFLLCGFYCRTLARVLYTVRGLRLCKMRRALTKDACAPSVAA